MKCECAKLEARIADLEEELFAAKRALGESEAIGDLAAVQTWLGISKGRAKIVLRLYRAKARFLPTWMLCGELMNADADPATVKAQVCHIRRDLGADAIEGAYGSGYRLSPHMHVRVSAALTAGA